MADKARKVSADVKITEMMKDQIKNMAFDHGTHYADMFRLIIVLGLTSMKKIENDAQGVNELLKLIKQN